MGRTKLSEPFQLHHMLYVVLILFRFLGNGILTQTDGALWKVRRRAYDAAFHKRLVEVMNIKHYQM